MSIFSAIRKTIITTFDTATDVMSAAQETVSMGTTFIHNRAVAQQIVDKDTIILETTKSLALIRSELEADKELASLYAETAKLFD